MNKERLIKTLKRHEGIKLRAYKCSAGKLTIGIGRNLDDKGISPQEADQMLFNDVAEVVTELWETIPDIMDSLNSTRQEVLINMAFNLGVPRLMKFKRMLAALQQEDYHQASMEMLDSKWRKQVKSRAIELSEMMERGHYLTKGKK